MNYNTLLVIFIVAVFVLRCDAKETNKRALYNNNAVSQAIFGNGYSVQEKWSSIILDETNDTWNVAATDLVRSSNNKWLIVGTTGNGSVYAKVDTMATLNSYIQLSSRGLKDTAFFTATVRYVDDSIQIYGSKGVSNVIVYGPFVLTHLLWDDTNGVQTVSNHIASGDRTYFQTFSCMQDGPDKLLCINSIDDTLFVKRIDLHNDSVLSETILYGTKSDVVSKKVQFVTAFKKYVIISCEDKDTLNTLEWSAIGLDANNTQISKYTLPAKYGNTPRIWVTDSGYVIVWNEVKNSASQLHIAYVDLSGQELWARDLLSDYYCHINGLRQVSDGGFVLYGYASHKDVNSHDVRFDSAMDCVIIKTDHSGIMEWSQLKGFTSLMDTYNNVVEVSPHEYVALGGCQYDSDKNSSWEKMFAVSYSEAPIADDVTIHREIDSGVKLRYTGGIIELSCDEMLNQVQLYSCCGDLIRNYAALQSTTFSIPDCDLESGCYYLTTVSGKKVDEKQIVVVH